MQRGGGLEQTEGATRVAVGGVGDRAATAVGEHESAAAEAALVAVGLGAVGSDVRERQPARGARVSTRQRDSSGAIT